jgi:hypothetical protein
MQTCTQHWQTQTDTQTDKRTYAHIMTDRKIEIQSYTQTHWCRKIKTRKWVGERRREKPTVCLTSFCHNFYAVVLWWLLCAHRYQRILPSTKTVFSYVILTPTNHADTVGDGTNIVVTQWPIWESIWCDLIWFGNRTSNLLVTVPTRWPNCA